MSAKDKKIDILLKFLVVGDDGVGKTSAIVRYVHDLYTPEKTTTTIGIDFKVKIINVESKKIKLQIWDTAGKDKFQTQTTTYYSGSQVILLMYDVTKRSSFVNVHNWITQIKMHSDPNVIIILMGNKCDRDDLRTVTYEEADTLASELKISFFECSSCQNINIEESFIHGIEEYMTLQALLAEAAATKSPSKRNSRTMEALLNSPESGRETTSHARNTFSHNSINFNSPDYKKHEFEFMVEFQKSAPHILLSGVNSWRKNVINGVYKPEKGELSPKFTNIDNNTISLILHQCNWYLKVKSKIVCKIWCFNNILSMPFIAKSENNFWYEKMGVFLPIYRARKNIRCEICNVIPETKKGKGQNSVAVERDGRTSICLRSSLVNNKPFLGLPGASNDDEFEEDNFTFSHYLEYEPLPAALGLSIVLYIQFLVIKIALLELDYKNNSNNANVNKGTIEEIKLRYRDLVANLNTSILLNPPIAGQEYCCAPLTLIDISVGSSIKQYLCNVLQYIIIDSNNLLTILSELNKHPSSERCQLTADQIKETLKLVLLSDMSLKADKIEWVVDDNEENAVVEDNDQPAHTEDSIATVSNQIPLPPSVKPISPIQRMKKLANVDDSDDESGFHSTVERETFTVDGVLDTSMMVSNKPINASGEAFRIECGSFVEKFIELLEDICKSEQLELPDQLKNPSVQSSHSLIQAQILYIVSKANKKFEDASSSGSSQATVTLSVNTVINTINSMFQYITMVLEDVLLTSITAVRESLALQLVALTKQFDKIVKVLSEENFNRNKANKNANETEKIEIVKSMISDIRGRTTTLQFK